MQLRYIKGISEKREADFNKLGVYDSDDLIRYFPRNYLDLTSTVSLEQSYNNDVVLTYGVLYSPPQAFTTAKRLKCVRAIAEQGGVFYTVIWFNQPYVLSRLKVGERYFFYGRVKKGFNGITITNPSFEPMDKNERLKGIIPVYTSRGALTQKVIRDSIKAALFKTEIADAIPESIRKKYSLSPVKKAYEELHSPTDFSLLKSASERVAIEEYFLLLSAFKFIKGDREQVRLNSYGCDAASLRAFISRFGFEFTEGQKKAVNEIFADMTGHKSMNRLLQGDVGSGKTAVGLCAIYIAVKSGYQAAMLAPTEILAEQNYNIISKLFPEYETVFLSGSLKVAEKRAAKEKIKSGSARIVVGTHAILTEDIEFYNLSMCVCDEQHRFGVQQRSALVSKGVIPDVLVMSATPIPRTLSLIFYGDLDITEITDKPKDRKEVGTFVVPPEKYDGLLGFIKDSVKLGKQAFCVCPKIDEDEEGTLMSVTELYEELSEKLAGVRVSLLHGKMKDAEKKQVMQDFKDKKSDVLVSTTVVEVGIDVPNATVMVIYNAERFGLSQLHQLRGRVGRGGDKSYCFLYTSVSDGKATERLEVLCKNKNGFVVAEKDFEMRGGGDFMGTRQSGKFLSDLGNLNFPPSVIFFAKRLSDEAFSSPEYISEIKGLALDKYEKLKDVTLN
ncbi:MAG: ATP-dependent DNA helicase RecG [Clostridia bacterium]|nr:ATP-dependent DNA helicase RecG [Clostridia bacterium]